MKYLSIITLLFIAACGSSGSESDTDEMLPAAESTKSVTFESRLIADDANLWWARTFHDVDGDGIKDIILHDNNGSGGWLGYLSGNKDNAVWGKVIIAESAAGGGKFAAGDLDAADLDGDGDLDLIGVEHPGEWTDADADASLYAYFQEEDEWDIKEIGSIPSALKDIEITDLDNDGFPEIITVTYNAETLSIFSMDENGEFRQVMARQINNLHEGLDAGDIDGDGFADIAANGYWMRNPGKLEAEWALDTIDARWFSQEEDHWARNATKTVCKDTDGDGRVEVFISHSEKDGYPVMRYTFDGEKWIGEEILPGISAAHSLQVEDIDLDGDYEVLTGVNRNRAINIAEESGTEIPVIFPVLLLDKIDGEWVADTLNTDGVYNLLVGDLEGDGDIDLIRLTSHDMKEMCLMENMAR